ncbi:MAG: ClbS/DfsB family four-helix bundle protein [Clostridiales bacterium]|nr:ClbS/DfsB family four-helix bundle protein [Clostridiales bacterium]
MPRPTTKAGLLAAANTQFEKMWALIDAMPESERNAVFCFDAKKAGKEAHWERDKNLRDVLIHLYEWHKLLLDWVKHNQSGNSRPFLPEPYNWKTYGDMNAGFWKKHQTTAYEKSVQMLKESHGAVMLLIDSFSDTELFEKKHFPWTGASNLGGYCVSVAPSHYDWAIKKIKAQIKALKERETV